jgi:signal transduction histidine kinase
MLRRYRAASRLQRQAMGPAFIAGTLLGLAHYAIITARQLGAPADTVIALSSVWTFCIVGVCGACLFGLVWRQMRLAGRLERLGIALRASDDREHTRDALATALDDSTADLLFRDPGSGAWRDARGHAVRRPQDRSPDRAVAMIDTDDGQQEAALTHDAVLLDDQELLDGVRNVVLAGLRHEHLAADLGRAMGDLEDSRRRIAEAADHERARIERDLHDGAQQRLVALRIRLGIAEDLLTADRGAGIQVLHELGFEAERAIEELRSLVHGVYPPLLTDRGPPEALRSVAAQAPLPVHVVANGVTRLPVEVESAVYFTCVEALQNAIKHAGPATAVWIQLGQTQSGLRFEVRDDGLGFVLADHDGRGLRNMHDRIEAIGGDLTVESDPGEGTSIVGSVPLPA